MSELWDTKQLKSFFLALAGMDSVRAELGQTFEERTDEVLARMIDGSLSNEEMDSVHDAIVDLVQNESEIEESLEGAGPENDTFSINIMRFGTVYWIEAAEFDDIGYFNSLQEAMSVAEANYEPFITALEERDGEEEADEEKR